VIRRAAGPHRAAAQLLPELVEQLELLLAREVLYVDSNLGHEMTMARG
jgi:hypothetical protein